MKNMRPFCFLLLIFANLRTIECDKLALIVLDGFRWDYIARIHPDEAPNFNNFIQNGVKADYVQPIVPSISFPSWTTIVTGLYPESHGIMGNYMYDESNGEEFVMDDIATVNDNTNNPIWWRSHVPLWTSATENDKMSSAYLFSRCDVPFKGNILPQKCTHYDNVNVLNGTLFQQNLNSALNDLKNGFELTIVYYCNVDQIGHIQGPETAMIDQEVKFLDGLLGQFMNELAESGLTDDTNVIIVSDHGMADITNRGFKTLAEYTSTENVEKALEIGAFTYISLKDKTKVDQTLQDLQKWPGVRAFKRSEIPEYYHLAKNDLVHDIFVMFEGQDLLKQEADKPSKYIPQTFYEESGLHGWDDTKEDPYTDGEYPDMRGIFLAQGPMFKKGYNHPWIKLVDEYQIFLKVLDLEGEEHNGTWSRVQDMFANKSTMTVNNSILTLALGSIVLLFLFISR